MKKYPPVLVVVLPVVGIVSSGYTLLIDINALDAQYYAKKSHVSVFIDKNVRIS